MVYLLIVVVDVVDMSVTSVLSRLTRRSWTGVSILLQDYSVNEWTTKLVNFGRVYVKTNLECEKKVVFVCQEAFVLAESVCTREHGD